MTASAASPLRESTGAGYGVGIGPTREGPEVAGAGTDREIAGRPK